ncbi:hypothetical protein FRC04_008611 [Tulasnella sp. 424]|nr:hypothetical protein FRC04_008611 [Tulasnella sp. 424]
MVLALGISFEDDGASPPTLFVAILVTFIMRFIAILVLVLAYGPAIFDLAVTGRAVNRPTQTSTTNWALAQFYTLHTGKPSLAILPTGLGGAVLTGSDHGHNNQGKLRFVSFSDFNVDSTISIWTIYLLTTRRALANIGTFGSNFNRRRLDRQWRYIRGWWQSNSGRVIDEGLVVYIYSLVLLTGMLTIWRKRATEDLGRFIGRQLLPVGVPATCTGYVTVSEELHSGQEGPNSRRIIVITLLVFLGGFVIIHYEAVNDRVFWTVTIILSPGPSGSSAVSRRVDKIYRVVPRRTVTLPTRGLIEAGPSVVRRGGEPLPSHEQVAQPNVSPRRRPGSTSSSFTTIHSLEGVLVMASSFIGEGLHWSIQFYPFQHYHISDRTDNDHDKEELYEEEVDAQVNEEIDAQVNEEEVDGQVNAEEVEVSRKRKRPHRGGKKSRTRKQKHEMNKEEEADPNRED